MKNPIYTADLKGQYLMMKDEMQQAMNNVLETGDFINGSKVQSFETKLASYLGVKYVIGCGNGTDALQIALMALDLKEGDEVIVPSFTYAATVEVIALLKLTPIFVDVEQESFNLSMDSVLQSITPQTKAIIPVHLFGQSTNMVELMKIAKAHKLFVIEDNAQSVGTDTLNVDGLNVKTGTIGDIGCTSFFPTKNLGCYGDGGALTTNNDELAARIRKICNHGQSKKYHHQILGVNSRLDTIQAAVLEVKLKHLDELNKKRRHLAHRYSNKLKHIDLLVVPQEADYSSHIYHQYTIRVLNGQRNELQKYLSNHGIFCVIYYPIPAHKQEAYRKWYAGNDLNVSEQLAEEVLSLPVYAELTEEEQDFIMTKIIAFYNGR